MQRALQKRQSVRKGFLFFVVIFVYNEVRASLTLEVDMCEVIGGTSNKCARPCGTSIESCAENFFKGSGSRRGARLSRGVGHVPGFVGRDHRT